MLSKKKFAKLDSFRDMLVDTILRFITRSSCTVD